MGKAFAGKLTWVGHPTFILETPGGKRLLLDAFIDSSPTTPDELKGDGIGPLDGILISHGHGDHVADAAAHQQRTGAPLAGMLETVDWIGTHGGIEDKIVAFNKGGTIEFAGVHVTMTHAQHSNSMPDGSYGGEPAGFVVTLEDGYRIYYSGDTNVFGDMALIRELYEPDLAILCIGGHYTMDPKEAALAVDLLGVHDVIGMHWGTFPPLTGTPQQLQELVGDEIRVHALEPGDTWAG